MENVPQASYDMHDSRFFLIAHSLDGKTWQDDELVEKTPIHRVREILGGRWDRSASYGTTFMKAFFLDSSPKRVLVLGFPPEMPKEVVVDKVKSIRLGREDRS